MLGPYPVERELGRGGMGIVYLARDPRLNRLVAIKIVPDALAMNPENLARFEREARLLAAVNHPNIAHIYGIEEVPATSSGQPTQRLLVMEYVAGETLGDRIRRGAIPVAESLDYARQIAAAIEAAHEAGIVHRDLKPGNVRITPDGVVKVLDFGLAKGGVTSDAEQAQSPTITYSPTGFGVILGTAGYMSPEQARGKPVDKRADVWAFGCVLYECLTARKSFEGETVSDTIARILEREPVWADLPPSTPPRVRDLLRRCLEKDLKKRQRDIGDVRIEIEEAIAQQMAEARSVSSSSAPAPAPPAPRSLVRRYGLPALLVLLGIAVGVGVWAAMFGGSRGGGPPLKLSIDFPSDLHIVNYVFTRDGKSLILRGSPRRPDGTNDPVGRLYLRPLDSWGATLIPGTEGVDVWARSPDGRSVAAVVPVNPGSVDRQIVRASLDGTSPTSVIAEWQQEWNDLLWLENNEVLTLTAQSTKLVRIPIGGKPAEPIAIDYGRPQGGYPDFRFEIAGGRIVMRLETFGTRGYQSDIWALDVATGKATLLVENGAIPSYVADTGHLLFSRGASLMAVRLDVASLTTSGETVTLFDGLRAQTWGAGSYSLSSEGHLAFAPGGRLGTDRRVVAVSTNREIVPFVAERNSYEEMLEASPDGRQIAVIIPTTRGTFEVWTGGQDRPDMRKTVSLPSADAMPAGWSPDGAWLAFTRNGRDLKDGAYITRADGTGEPKPLMLARSIDEPVGVMDWPRAGSQVIVVRVKNERPEYFSVPVSASGEIGEPRPFTLTKNSRYGVRISPDGQLIAFEAEDSGRSEIYVALWSGQSIVGAPVLVSKGGGAERRWSRDSKRLYYRQPSSQLMSVTIDRNPLRATTPVMLHDFRALRLNIGAWDILPDGRLIGIEMGAGEDDPTSVNIALNWLATVRARLPR